MHELTAVVARGLEPIAEAELIALGAATPRKTPGAVRFRGTLECAYRVCLFTRTCTRVLLPIAQFETPSDGDALYRQVRSVPWHLHLGPDQTLAIDCVKAAGVAGHTRFLMQRSKDAICDQLRDRHGRRPSVDRARPDLRLHLHLGREQATLSVDLGGGSLHRRGYRAGGGQAPLKETLAAALLLHAGWPERARAGQPLLDPLCGSGTLLIEGALIALDVAPGLLRPHHGMLGWRGHDAAAFQRVLGEANQRREAARGRRIAVFGFDHSEAALQSARGAAAAASVGTLLNLERRALEHLESPPGLEPGLVVTNPPYGERLGAASELLPLYEQLGDTLKREFGGWTAYVLCGNPLLAKHIGLRAAGKLALYNGPIACQLLELPITARKDAATPGSARAGERPPGPGWRKPSPQAQAFENRLRKNARHFDRMARRQGLEAYRIYDADIPEYNLAVDRYGDHVCVQEYAAPRSVDPELAMRRVRDALLIVPQVLQVPREAVLLKVRKRQVQGGQYERRAEALPRLVVREAEQRFWVELHAHLDTGLFSEQRLVRRALSHAAAGGCMLNLFAYTCTAGVYAAAAGAKTTNVDLSASYLEWGRDNYRLADLDPAAHDFVQEDCLAFLRRGDDRFDTIMLNPPSYSRSHRMGTDFDVKRDHPRLLASALHRLAFNGSLYFVTHARGFALRPDLADSLGVQIEDVSARLLPADFRRSPFFACVIRHRPRRTMPDA